MTITTSELTGEKLDTASPEWRHECEVCFVLELPNKTARHHYLAGIAQRRGEPSAQKLRDDVQKLYEIRKAKRDA